jgi:hypothetical protein
MQYLILRFNRLKYFSILCIVSLFTSNFLVMKWFYYFCDMDHVNYVLFGGIGTFKWENKVRLFWGLLGLWIVLCIDLVLIDQQSVGKRSLHLMSTVNEKKRWTTIYWRVNRFLKESHVVTRSFLKINDINNISFFERLTVIIDVLLRKREC